MQKEKKSIILFSVLSSLLIANFFIFSALAQAQSSSSLKSEIEQLKKEISDLKKQTSEQNQSLIDEVALLKTTKDIPALGTEDQTQSQMGLAASKVYYSNAKVSIGGYGEAVYKDDRRQGQANTTDLYRFVPYIGYRFNDWIVLNSELEFEHGGADEGSGEAAVEFMYLDFLLHPAANIRVGNYLIPVGLTNLKHEPTYFGSVYRPLVETNIIPSTWHENGILVYGNASEDFSYQAGIFASPLATEASTSTANFSNSSWIRGGRQSGAQAKAEDFSGVIRLDYSGLPFSNIGASFIYGDSSQDVSGLSNLTYTLWEVHAESRWKGFDWNALYTQGTLAGAGELISTNPIGETVEGWYTTFSYDLMQLCSDTTYQLPVFIRYSEYDTNKDVPTGQTRNKSLSKKVTTVGINYKPHSQVVLKADFQSIDTEAGYEKDLLSLGMGFVF
ncbi:MAG: hypothetical protein KDD34_08355 [Bdellovibrionales bacterium]|nr:hypothetical protein [Bdellovibrionales bacterium]